MAERMIEYEKTKALCAQIHTEFGVTRKEALELAIKIRTNHVSQENSERLSEAIHKLSSIIDYKRFYQ